MRKRILIVLGHSSEDSLCCSIANTYLKGAQAAGHDVRLLSLGKLKFDPILQNGYNAIQALEPDLVAAQESMVWAEHMVFVYPIWWGSIPAILKGFFDRVLLPGFAFKFQKGALMADGLLAQRTAHLIATMDTPPWYYRWVYRMPGHNQMKRTILEFCGIKPVAVTSFGPVKSSKPATREKWLARAYEFGFKA
ncbi:NAD(P)H-dependent oxidoreductase [Limnobacter parvus]|uniref:NAD(P)H-dependent oxidoreductase n=1 Tax=Limnobacter parvus TaxID=2939690 RepID=A0ABT1XKV9_9BURK|nr:NAD(P)H-dependent oxidoreductase [Limnobacter parvus]MCR2747937.1 NAD(P)H-dependent oxidoreductase [Limnobacter parvus]